MLGLRFSLEARWINNDFFWLRNFKSNSHFLTLHKTKSMFVQKIFQKKSIQMILPHLMTFFDEYMRAFHPSIKVHWVNTFHTSLQFSINWIKRQPPFQRLLLPAGYRKIIKINDKLLYFTFFSFSGEWMRHGFKCFSLETNILWRLLWCTNLLLLFGFFQLLKVWVIQD